MPAAPPDSRDPAVHMPRPPSGSPLTPPPSPDSAPCRSRPVPPAQLPSPANISRPDSRAGLTPRTSSPPLHTPALPPPASAPPAPRITPLRSSPPHTPPPFRSIPPPTAPAPPPSTSPTPLPASPRLPLPLPVISPCAAISPGSRPAHTHCLHTESAVSFSLQVLRSAPKDNSSALPNELLLPRSHSFQS